MNRNILRKFLLTFIQLIILQLVSCAPQNIFQNRTFQDESILKPKDGNDDCESGEYCPEDPEVDECDDISNMCGRRFWTIFAVIIGVGILSIIVLVMTCVVLCVRKRRRIAKKLLLERQAEGRPEANKSITPHVEITPPRVSLPVSSSGNANNAANIHRENANNAPLNTNRRLIKSQKDDAPTAPAISDYENVYEEVSVDEPPPPYDDADSSHSNKAPRHQSDGMSARSLKEQEARNS